MLKIAILGFGFAGKAHAKAYVRMPDAKLTAIGGFRNQLARQQWQTPYPVEFHADPDVLLNSCEADIVDICLPTHLHEEFVVKAAAKGRHIVCEKPLALSLASADRMIGAVYAAGVTAMVAQVLRYFPHYRKSRELVQSGRLGQVFYGYASRLSSLPAWGEWFRDPAKSGGALFDLQVHDLDYLLTLFGVPQSVFAAGIRSQTGAWDHVVTTLSYSDKKACTEASYRMPSGWPFTSRLRLMGTQASIEYEFRVQANVDKLEKAQNRLMVYPERGIPEEIVVEDCDPFYCELRHFIESVSGRANTSSLQEARNVIGVLQSVAQSLESGEPVDVVKVLALASS
jgi:UDP-N-acetylglucosamine 3-dehydrogenase